MTNIDAIMTLVREIERAEKRRPLHQQGDVQALKKIYESTHSIPSVTRWFIFLIAWCLREPILVETFYERVRSLAFRQNCDEFNCFNVFQCVEFIKDVIVPTTRRFLPPRCRYFLNPTAILKMDFSSLFGTAVSAAVFFGAPITFHIKRKYEEIVLRRIRLIRGIGNYSASHFLR